MGKIRLQYKAVSQRPQANALDTVPQLGLHFLQATQADSNEPVQREKVLLLKAVRETACEMCHNYSDKNLTSIAASFYCLHSTSTYTCFSAVKIFPYKVFTILKYIDKYAAHKMSHIIILHIRSNINQYMRKTMVEIQLNWHWERC